ncbi:MAG: cytochrome ubiquinol oxidase subunit I, partial [Verrucomicrobia bacterium]|nr:cytochrome ubiquinol oxidase subunit I [Verrucomicrobiota bacterium]
MATESVKYVAPETKTKTLLDVFRRPDQHVTGIRDWLTTIDHKKIGLLYGSVALCSLIFGGMQALLIRSQLWAPNQELLTPREYNQ